MTDEGFARRIWEGYKELEKREGKPIAQRELAERIEKQGGHPTRQDDVSRWFRNAARPEYEELPAIAQVLGMDLMELTFGKPPQSLLGGGRKAIPDGETLLDGGQRKRRRKGA